MSKLLSSATKASILLASSGSYICQDKEWAEFLVSSRQHTHTTGLNRVYGMRGEGVRVERNREGRERRGGEEDKGNV